MEGASSSRVIRIRVLAFALLRERLGRGEIKLELPPGSRVMDMRRRLADSYPELQPLLSLVRVAVDGEYAEEETLLRDGSEVALVPPVSGGTDSRDCWVEITAEPIEVPRWIQWVERPTVGAVVSFLGTVREWTQERRTAELFYEAYQPMAEQKLRELVRMAQDRFGLAAVAVVHRTGSLQPGDISVLIAVAAPHRQQAFDGCRFLIEALKQEVPIWKKEVWSDGTSEWVHPGSTAAPGCEARRLTTTG
jgi:molybdopterin converting factor subunit 1